MNTIVSKGLTLWQFENLAKEPSIRHFVTGRSTRVGGAEFTLSYSSSPDKELIRKNRSFLAAAMGVSDTQLYFPSQVHKTRIVDVTRHTAKDELMDTDALITQEAGICIAVMSADCVPILLYDIKNKAAGAVHSGWKGTVARILEKTLKEMNAKYGTRGEDLIAGIGPSASQNSYEVGEEVINAVNDSFGTGSGLMIAQENKKARLDLWKANEIQLLEFGVSPSHRNF